MFARIEFRARAACIALSAALATALAPATAYAVVTDAPAAPPSAIKVEKVASGLVNPWSLQFLPDGRMLVTERPGRLRIIAKDGSKSEPIAGLPKVYASGQGGLLDIRLAKDFATSGTLFFSFAEPREGGTAGTSVGRGKLVLEGDAGRLEDVEVIYRQKPAIRASQHFGSRIVIDNAGALFVTTGDRGSQSDKAQDPDVPIGKVLRIATDGTPAPGNPGLDGKPGWAPEVWSIGHRNIQGAVLDPETGRLWTVEHGARGGDELNSPQAARNYGWPVISYGRHYSGQEIGVGTEKAGMEQPVYYWDPSIATSGLELYSGDLFPGWKGNLLVGGLAGAHMSRLVMENGMVVAEEKLLQERGDRIRDIRQGPDGAVYVLTDDSSGEILRLSPQ
ncbi:MAG: PQQ-dependent sugar dehydrogenase [Alphaproteobacteria bacterium]|nr:PQQ-dependent sugar dehydrogenase [Alphaproteobacteria bacterium]